MNHIHFVGIGGVGVSALARLFLMRGANISGSDCVTSDITKKLSVEGVTISIGHNKNNVPADAEAIVYSPAILEDNVERKEARNRGISEYSYPEALGIVSQDETLIAVSGTHGKTTTTAMLAEIFIHARKEPTVVVGSFLGTTKNNFVVGGGEYFIAEACEYRRSFLNFSPKILVITNIDEDHLDYYKDIADIQSAFRELAMKVPADGYIVCNKTHVAIAPVLDGVRAKIIDYTKKPNNIVLPIFGKHNIQNAQAALAVARIVEIEESGAREALANFHGTWRRFEYKGKTKNGVRVYDDYAHHPMEVRSTLLATREQFPDKKVIVIFQPHLYSRTKLFLDEFAESFYCINMVIVADIYAAREQDDGSVHARDLVKKIQEQGIDARYARDVDIKEEIRTLDEGDIFITMGAGDVYKIGESLLE